MEVVHTCPDVRYWSEVLYCAIPTHLSDLEVKITNLEILFMKILLKILKVKHNSGVLRCPGTALISCVSHMC